MVTQARHRPRILLLETRHDNPEHHRGVEFYPFLLAWCRSLGWDARWCVTVASRKTILQGETYTLDLDPGPLRAVLEEVRSRPPDVAVLMDMPSDGLRSAWRDVSPRTRFAVTKGRVSGDIVLSDVASWLGMAAPPAGEAERPLLESVPPCFDRHVLDAGLAQATREFHRLAVRMNCSYRRRVSGNRFFRPIADGIRGAWGCTFCFLPVLVREPRVRRADIERDIAGVLRQVLAHQAASPPHVTGFDYWLDQSLAGENVPLLLERLAGLDLRPTRITTLLRPDQLLARLAVLERVLPRMAERGHRLELVSVGADNLSAVENERFNKGIPPTRVLAAREAARDLARRWPEAFSCLDFSWILFTPWTRLSDLRDNIAGARRMGPGVLKGILGTVLQLWEGTPITALARHDGAVADRFEGSLALVEVSCVPPANVREVPWRFLDAAVQRAHAILVRLDPMPDRVRVPGNDPLLARIRAARKGLPRELDEDHARLALGVVDALAALGPDAAIEDLFDVVSRPGAT